MLGLLTPPPAHAQMQGYWMIQPCDVNGNLIASPVYDQYGFLVMSGPRSGLASNTYPAAMTQAALSDPTDFWFYLNMDRGYFPIPGLSSAYTGSYLYNGATVSGTSLCFEDYDNSIRAPNYVNRDNVGTLSTYSIYPTKTAPTLPTASGPINGSVTAHVAGQLSAYFKCVWAGPLPQPAYPDHLDFLLNTTLSVVSGIQYVTAFPSKATATATASDGLGESVTAVSPTPGNLNTYQRLKGLHLLRSAVSSSGMAQVSVSGTLDGTADNEVSYASLGPINASATASITGGAKQDTREVTISCPSIETNYHVGPLDPITKTYPQYVRAADGSMHADSVVRGTIAGHWNNSAGLGNSLTANTPGFTAPYYFWSKSGAGTVDSQTASSLGVNQQFIPTIPMNLDFGTQPSTISDPNTVVANNPFPLTTTVRVDVTDGPNTDKATSANTYTITYHLPFELPAKFGPEIPDDTPLQVVNPLVNTLTIIQIPPRVEAVDLADGAHIAGGLATAVSAGLPLVKVFVQVTEPDLVVAQTVFAVFGYTLGLATDAPPPTDPVPVATDYAEFKADVIHQVAINQQPVGQKDKIRFEPISLAPIVAAQLQPNNADWQKDPYFWPDPLKSQLSVSSQAFRYAKKQMVVGDGYGLKGYLGPKFHSVRAEGGFYTVTHWVYK